MTKNKWLVALALSVSIAGILSTFASPSPDGLERVAEDQGFLSAARQATGAVIPDYAMPGIADDRLATALAGIVGTLGVFALLAAVGRILYGPGREGVMDGQR